MDYPPPQRTSRARARSLRLGAGLTLALGLGLLTGLAADNPLRKQRVVASFFPVYCLAANVAGDAATVESLLSGNLGPHDYQLSPRDMKRLAQADLVVVIGLGLDDWVLRAATNAVAGPRPRVVALGPAIGDDLLAGLPHDHGAHEPEAADAHAHSHRHETGANPHVWLDPLLAMRLVDRLVEELRKLDPPRADIYRRNGEAFKSRLAKLDEEIRAGLEAVRDRPFVTYHDAFPYFVRRYGLRLVGVVEDTPDAIPSPRRLKELIAGMREGAVKVVFSEPQAASAFVRQFARDAGVAVGELDTLESGPLDPGAYEAGMRRNLETLRRHLK
jgi:zinc/manganese transport system substrate-binding protein